MDERAHSDGEPGVGRGGMQGGTLGTDLGVYARILKPLHPSIWAIAAPHPATVHTGTG